MSAEGEMKTEATKQEVQTGQSEPVAPGGPEPDHNADKVNKGGAVPEDSQPIIVDKPDAETARQEMDTDKPKIDEPIAALTLYGFILVMSFVVMVEASIECDRANNCSDERGWAVTVSVISIICTGVAIALEMYTDVCSDIIGVIFAFFLLLLWSGGAGVLTFRAPFTATGNGYFASWLAWFASAYLVYSESPFLKRRVSEVFSAGLHFKSMLAIVLGSIVVLIAGAILCAEENCTNQNAYSVAVPSVAIPIVLPFMFLTMLQEYAIWASMFMALWWLIGAAVLTFDRPFTFTGNGYFGTWVAALGSLYWFYLCGFEEANIVAKIQEKIKEQQERMKEQSAGKQKETTEVVDAKVNDKAGATDKPADTKKTNDEVKLEVKDETKQVA